MRDRVSMPLVAKYVCATVILVALLGGLIYLSATHGPPEAIASVGTAFGLAVSAVLPMVTGKDAPKGAGPTAVVLAALAGLTSEACAAPLPPAMNVENAAAVAQYEALLADCRAQGEASHSYEVYEACARAVDKKLCAETGARCVEGGAK